MVKKLFTSEQVSCGHPDKMCDQISDAILDACLEQDKMSRVACEVLMKENHIVLAGEITSNAIIDYEKIIKNVLSDIGIENLDRFIIENYISKQSSDIALGVDIGGAGDQGIMFGYACNETPEKMPLAWSIATKALINLRNKHYDFLKPDAKSQVTIDYADKKHPRIDTFLISTQHIENISQQKIHEVVKQVMEETALEYNMNTDFKWLVNPTGKFVLGGADADAGVTGRKIICDSYGGYGRHGGGSFSTKDPTKVDRSAAYMARYLAKYVVTKGYATECEIQLAYAIGVAQPVSINVNCFGTETISIENIEKEIENKFDLSPLGIINFLHLRNPIYKRTSAYGHFGKEDLPWEQIK